MVAFVFKVSYHSARIRSKIRFGQTETPDHFARGKLWQIFHALFFVSVFPDRIHHERRLSRRRQTNSQIASFNLLHNQSKRNLVEPRTAVFHWNVRPESANFTKSFD